jgi:SAM-dependent methyltransferase
MERQPALRVAVSKPSVRLMNWTPRSRNSSTTCTRWETDLPSRSSFHTTLLLDPRSPAPGLALFPRAERDLLTDDLLAALATCHRSQSGSPWGRFGELVMDYVHGYSARECARLTDQATTLTGLLHAGTRYTVGSRVLEAGCGTGAQTVILAAQRAQAEFTCIDVSRQSLAVAARRARRSGCANVTFQHADIFSLPFGPSSIDMYKMSWRL